MDQTVLRRRESVHHKDLVCDRLAELRHDRESRHLVSLEYVPLGKESCSLMN